MVPSFNKSWERVWKGLLLCMYFITGYDNTIIGNGWEW